MKKNLSILIAMLLFACSTSNNEEKEKAEIINLLEKETKYVANADIPNWSSCWVNSDEASFIYTDVNGNQNYSGINSIKEAIGGMEPFDLKLSRDNYRFVIGKELAFVTYDQTDNWGGGTEELKKETRTLKKVDGEWKIVNTSVVNVSSFEMPVTEPFHMTATKIPPKPNTGFTYLSGFAGMSIGYIAIPGEADFSPLFKGLPHDMCNSPHWGYVIDGKMYVTYPGGRKDTINKGEVFYLPAPHTGRTEKGVKFIDFSPDEEYSVLMDQIAKNMAVQASK